MKPIKKPFLNSVTFIAYGLLIAFLAIALSLPLMPMAYAEALPVSALAPTDPTIIGGQPADVGEWPWQAVVMVGANFCGGTLIDVEWLLTVAHCVYDTNKELYPSTAFQVTLGDYNLYTIDESEQHFTVDQVFVHPALNFVTYENDIALLHLATPAVVDRYVAPIALSITPDDQALATPGTLAVVTGWGATKENGGLAPILREVQVPLIANPVCHQSYGLLTDNMLCAGYAEGGKDACQGDSGSPLMLQEQTGRWKLAGLVSFGYGCGRPLFYGVYTRVANYTEWIQTITGPLEAPLGVTTDEVTATPTLTATVTVAATATAPVTPAATASPTPTPPTSGAPLPSPTRSETMGQTAQSFLPVVYH